MLLFSDMLYILVRYASPSGTMCLRRLMLTLSSPVELLYLLCFIGTWTCVVVSVMLVVYSLSVFLSWCLFVLRVLCFTVLVNCLLNAFAICVDEKKVMVLFLRCVGVLLASQCIVFQRVCVLCLWSQCVSRCSLHMSDLCVYMRDVISEFNSEIEGSLAYCAMMLFLCSILCFMCSGSSLHVECILPFGMLCLSAWIMMFVKMVFAVCVSGGGRMSASLGVCSELCPVCFPIVYECVSVLL